MPAPSRRVVIVAAEFNRELIDAMIETAQDELKKARAELLRIVRVPGSYEIPLIADAYLSQDGVDALVALGYIERGETLHGEVMGHVVHSALVQLQLKYRKPIGIGIIGPGATGEQAHARKINSALSAARAAIGCCELLSNCNL